MPHIWIRDNTRKKLREIKNNTNFSSYDEIIDLSVDILIMILNAKEDQRGAEDLLRFVNSLIDIDRRRRGI